jgi:hypothetical protein
MNHFYLIPRRFKIININRIYKKCLKNGKCRNYLKPLSQQSNSNQKRATNQFLTINMKMLLKNIKKFLIRLKNRR